jgi:CRP/FNR family transcriptional regulator
LGGANKKSGKWHVSGKVPLETDTYPNFPKCLQSKECALISAHSYTKPIRKKDTIYSQGDSDNNTYILDAGIVKLCRTTPHGDRLITDIIGKRNIFGGPHDTHGGGRLESAVAIEDGVLHVVSTEGMSKIEKTQPKLLVKINGILSGRKRRMENRIVDLLFRSVEQRFALMLLSLIHDFGSPYKGGYLLNLSLTHQVYADLIASTRETVTTVLNRLRKNGIIDYEGRSIVVRAPGKLSEIAGQRARKAGSLS